MPESAEPLRVTLRCFAAVRDTLGVDQLLVEVAPGTTAQGLRELLGEQHPALLRVPVAVIALVTRVQSAWETRNERKD